MTDAIDRREFQRKLSLMLTGAAVAPLTGCSSKPGETPAGGAERGAASDQGSGLFSITRGEADLRVPPDTPADKSWRYGLIFPFQVAADRAAAFVNIRIRNGVMAPARNGDDYEVGGDVVLFDDVSGTVTSPPVAVMRNHEEPNPNSTPPKQPSIMVKYPMRGGFVPAGAKKADGSPHPHAGTGFGINMAIARHPGDPKSESGGGMYEGGERYSYLELFQFAYNDGQFQVTGSERIPQHELLPDWFIANGGLTNAIPDGDDLLVAMSAGRIEKTPQPGDNVTIGGGIMRWQRKAGTWRPISFIQATGNDSSTEASLIRDVDGNLLLSARGSQNRDNHAIRVWRSLDNGGSWEKIIHVADVISSSPITLNQAADGTPYIASNIFMVPLDSIPKRFRIPADKQGRVRGGGWTRQKLYLWPLTEDRSGLQAPILGRHCKADFGPAPSGSMWRADHPVAATVRLADGKWHNIMGYRIHDDVESHDLEAPPQTGAYLEEVVSAGEPIPTWNF